MQVGDGDHTGAPAMTAAFERYLTTDASPLQRALARMHSAGAEERTGALFLFILACSDFDPARAGQRMMGCHHTPRHVRCLSPCLPLSSEYALWYAEKALHRLRQRLAQRDTPRAAQRKPWMDRVGLANSTGGR